MGGTVPSLHASPATPNQTPEPARPTAAPETPVPSDASPGPSIPGTAEDAWTGPGPNADEAKILSRVPDGLFTECRSIGANWNYQIQSIVCFTDRASIVYGLFPSVAAVRAAYDLQSPAQRPRPVPASTCDGGAFESGYTIDGKHLGRWRCTTVSQNGLRYRVMEWTHEPYRMIGYLGSAVMDWAELMSLSDQAGPGK